MENFKYIEVELKFPLLNPNELIEKLNSIARSEKKVEIQEDIYFNSPHRDFLEKKPVSEWLRIRKSEKCFSLNYKKWHNDDGNKTISCNEFETKIEDVNALKKLLGNLNFIELITVEKNRRIWNYKDAEIAIDEIRELGSFIEIEAKGNFSGIEEAKNHLYKILEELGAEVGEQDFEGYPYLLLKQKGLL